MATFQKITSFLKGWFARSLIIIILLFSILILSIMLVNLSYSVDHLAKSVINQTTNRARLELDNYFKDVVSSLKITRDLIEERLVKASDDFSINKYVLPVFNSSPDITTLAVADQDGDEYSFIREDSTWLNNFVYETDSGMNIIRERWKGSLSSKTIVKQWNEYNVDYDPRNRPWYKGALAYADTDEPFWTDPYVFFTQQEPGITVSTMVSFNDTSFSVVQYDIMITDISKFTTTQKISRNGKSFILTKNLNYIGLPTDSQYQPMDSIKKYILKPVDSVNNSLLVDFKNHWNAMDNKYNQPFQFKSGNHKWWGSIQKYELCKDNYFLIGVVVPERDFLVEIKKSRNIIIAGFSIVLLFIIVVVRSYMIKKKANILLSEKNRKIQEQKKEIESQRDTLFQQQKEITDSINYACQIQNALLPQEGYIEQCMPEHFILFKPRDIVSGDFYWIRKFNQYLVIIAADCTGHGVPGAFMSMLGISALNEITLKMEKPVPSKIMNQLRDKVIESLHQKKGIAIKDGMDMALCVLNLKTNEMQFSGANNPVYIARKKKDDAICPNNKRITRNGYELVQISADKMPVGIHLHLDQSFSETTYQLEKGDAFYVFSDGYADQFGGQFGKKFKYKPFKKLLLDNFQKPMGEQLEILNTTFDKWTQQYGHKQIDDIVVIGVKV